MNKLFAENIDRSSPNQDENFNNKQINDAPILRQ